ncbi:energy transducer TonB [Sphingomonas sp. GCM10030256]|uniref:energy transducer TonB n=1 Tax=Sphingomonas sp. GCM10030256 TaxID=3273427 RepID=UPI003621148D
MSGDKHRQRRRFPGPLDGGRVARHGVSARFLARSEVPFVLLLLLAAFQSEPSKIEAPVVRPDSPPPAVHVPLPSAKPPVVWVSPRPVGGYGDPAAMQEPMGMPGQALFERATGPSPRQPLPSLISAADYPAEAMRNDIGGASGVVLLISSIGRVGGCHVEKSSGSAALDSATCRLLASRARFIPAKDEDGQPVESATRVRIQWKLPPRLPLTDWSTKVVAAFGADGQVKSCEETLQGLTRPPGVTCKGIQAVRQQAMGGESQPAGPISARMIVTAQLVSSGADVAPVRVPADRLLMRVVAELTVGTDGRIAACTVKEKQGVLPALSSRPPDCMRLFRGLYERPKEPRKVTVAAAMWTLPE